MSYTLIWKYAPAEEGEQVLIGHPGTFSDDDTTAKEEGRRILADDQIDWNYRDALTPLAVVEVSEDMGEEIQDQCDEVEIGDELLFYDLGGYAHWKSHSWWPKTVG